MNLLSLVNKTIKEDANLEPQVAGGVKTDAQASVSADNMSLNTQSTLTHAEVADHLKKADDAAEEVETVTFGLETDNGDVIKVYVAVPDADNFEKALAKKLGEEDDIEQVLDDLADQFDIVDVKWPEEESDATDTFAADDEEKDEVVHDIEQDQPDEDDKEEAEDDLNKEIGAGDSAGADGEEKKGGLDKSSDEDPLTSDSDDSSPLETDDENGEEKKGGLKKDNDEESPLETDDESKDEESEDEESPLEDDEEKPKKGGLNKNKKEGEKMEKKGGLKKESVELSLIKGFIAEDAAGAQFDDPIISKMYQEVPNRQQKLIIEVLSALGVPGDILKLRHSKFKHNLKIAGEMVLENTHLRIWMQKFVDAARSIKHTDDDDHKPHTFTNGKVDNDTASFVSKSAPVNTAESLMGSILSGRKLFEKEDPTTELGADSTDVEDILKIQIHNRIAAMALAIIAKLGVDDEVVRSRRFTVKRSVTKYAKRIAKSTRAKMALLMVAGALGIAKDPHTSHIILPHEKETEVEESVDTPMEANDEEKLGATIYAESVHKLLLALGIPEEQLDFKNSALRAAINNKKKSIKHMSKVMTRINHLIDALTEVDEDYDESDEISKAELMAGRHKKADDNAPADLGEWDIAVIDDTVVLKVEDFKITIEIGEDGIDKILDSIADGDVASVKCDGKRITFRPTNRGRDYVVKEFGNTKYPNGILLNQKSIDEIADAI